MGQGQGRGNFAPQLQLVSPENWKEAGGMNPLVIIIPIVVASGGLLGFLLLPVPFGIRLAVLISDLAAAAVIGLVLIRRSGR